MSFSLTQITVNPKILSLTLRFRTPQREKSVIFSMYAMFSGSPDSGRMEQALSISGLTFRSSANSGEPLNPTGFFNRAVIRSAVLDDVVANEHWISLTWRKLNRSVNDSSKAIHVKEQKIFISRSTYHHSLVPWSKVVKPVKKEQKWAWIECFY